MPSSNITVTLAPRNNGDGLLLTTEADTNFAGHYLSVVEADRGDLTTLKLLLIREEIDVGVRDGGLTTDHRFSLGGVVFLTLHYVITRA